MKRLKGRRPPLSGRELRGGGCVVLAHLLCWVYWLLVVLSVLVFLWNVRKQVVFWRSFFMVFPLVAVSWDTNFIISGAPNLSFDRPGATIFLPWNHFVSLGTPERTMEGHMGAQNRIFCDLGWFWDLILKVFWAVVDKILCFCWSLVPGHFLHRFLGGIIDSWSS